MGDGGDCTEQPLGVEGNAHTLRCGVLVHVCSTPECPVHHGNHILFRHLKPISKTKDQVIAKQQDADQPGQKPSLHQKDCECCKTICQRQSLQHPQDAEGVKVSCCHGQRLPRSHSPRELTEPSQGHPDPEDEEGASCNFPQCISGGFEIELAQREVGGDPHDEHEEGEDQVGGCEPVPVCMAQWFVDILT